MLAVACDGAPVAAVDASTRGFDAAAKFDVPAPLEVATSADAGTAPTWDAPPPTAGALGATEDPAHASITFRVFSAHATRVELSLFARTDDVAAALRVPLVQVAATGVWATTLPRDVLVASGITSTVFYGYRAWGPNWPWVDGWTPGSALGFVADVDAAGNRFDPNKLLIDPYAREITHDPVTLASTDGAAYRTGPTSRARDSGPVAPKSIVVDDGIDEPVGDRPTRPLRDEVVYEVHLRGFTMGDPSAPAGCAGTYAAAGARAAYLADLGVTAVEFLPVQETQNDANDAAMSTRGMNYWGYATLAYLAPDRRYSCDRTPGGPTREFRAMVRAFHEHGLKVYLDVVFNHTAEGGAGGTAGDTTALFSLRGLDNATYYELARDARYFEDETGIGANVATAVPATRRLVLDALAYWAGPMGVDGFRFDLAAVLGNTCTRGCFSYERDATSTPLTGAVTVLPARAATGGAGVDLIAEPWGVGAGTYQLGNFPRGWAEWNGQYRDLVRQSQNQLGVATVTPGWLSDRIAGSSELFRPRGRGPAASVNYLVSHDGFTLFDLYHCNGPNNAQPWPLGPSDGGTTDNYSWDQGGDASRQRQAARTGLALLLMSAGVPMLTGGDEMLRTVHCNNNPYNLDSSRNWLDWSLAATNAPFATFARRMLRFRAAHPALRPADFWSGMDHDGNGLADVTWYRADATRADGTYMDDAAQRFLAWRLDGSEFGDIVRSIYVAYNRDAAQVAVVLPTPRAGAAWYQAADTGAWLEGSANSADPGAEARVNDNHYTLAARAVAVLVER